MDEIKKLTADELKEIVASQGFDPDLTLKDYYITAILYLLKDVEGIYFKGGTALQKIFLEYSRLSEDVDYTCTKDIAEVKEEIKKIICESRFFGKITKDKDVEGFLRLVIHYNDLEGEDSTVFIDLNKRAELVNKPEYHKIHHFYQDSIPDFTVKTLSQHEMVAEKMAATIGRNKPRDHFDLYRIIEIGMKIDLDLVAKKCKQSGDEFNILKMFNKAKKLRNRWEEDLLPLLIEEVPFEDVIKTLAKQFNLKEVKEKQKDKKGGRQPPKKEA